MRVLALDLGSRRIGLALSDAEGVHAFPQGALERAGGDRDLAALRALIEERGVERVVVGLPIHMSGRRGPEARDAEAFAAQLARVAGIPVDTFDERWTTVEADRILRETGRTGKKRRKGEVDAIAASILLRAYLDRERRRGV
jgi:putative Holliday junction resolvase